MIIDYNEFLKYCLYFLFCMEHFLYIMMQRFLVLTQENIKLAVGICEMKKGLHGSLQDMNRLLKFGVVLNQISVLHLNHVKVQP